MNKLVVTSIIVVSAIGLGVGLSLKPWQVYREQRKLADDAIREMRTAESKKTELTRQRAQAESSLGREELARKQGYRRPDETPLEVPDTP
ncbi:MAG: hypothetical protein IT363_09670 [Methanoregulaceae archaeon]|jgi:hypothetical protein|nr:hypothetical protein [Methanoregulaceae archaeon]